MAFFFISRSLSNEKRPSFARFDKFMRRTCSSLHKGYLSRLLPPSRHRSAVPRAGKLVARDTFGSERRRKREAINEDSALLPKQLSYLWREKAECVENSPFFAGRILKRWRVDLRGEKKFFTLSARKCIFGRIAPVNKKTSQNFPRRRQLRDRKEDEKPIF